MQSNLESKDISTSIGVAPSVLPEVRSENEAKNLQSWVSTPYTPVLSSTPPYSKSLSSHWYVLRTTYGQERKAYDYLTAKGVNAYLPIEKIYKIVQGKRKLIEKSLITNIFFAYGTEEEMQTYVYDNVNLPFLRFYYRYYHEDNERKKTPLIVPNAQMNTFRIICESEVDNIIVSTRQIPRFKRGEMARVIDGKFKGVVGRVVRYKGQQRVGIIINGLLSVATAYIPEAFLERLS